MTPKNAKILIAHALGAFAASIVFIATGYGHAVVQMASWASIAIMMAALAIASHHVLTREPFDGEDFP